MDKITTVADLLNRCVRPGESHRGYVRGDVEAMWAPYGRLGWQYGMSWARLAPRLAAEMPGCVHVIVWRRY